jgi:hypothetical protein
MSMRLEIDEPAMEALTLRLVARWTDALRSVAREMDLPPPLLSEAERLAYLKARSVAPESCGPDMPVAPARGPVVAVTPLAMRRGRDGYDVEHVGHAGRDAARARDVWDEMADQARRAGGVAPFTPAQVATGRAYAALVERHQACGLRGISVETMMAGRGGSGGGGYMDSVLAEGRRLDALNRQIGDGVALEVQRRSRRARDVVTVRALVDGVCLHGRTVADQLRRSGWDTNGPMLDKARGVVAAALDRMALV